MTTIKPPTQIKPVLLHSFHLCQKNPTSTSSPVCSCFSTHVCFFPTCSVSAFDSASVPTSPIHTILASIVNQPKYGAVNLATSFNYFPWLYLGNAHDPSKQGIPIGTTNNRLMQSVATDIIQLAQLPLEARRCLRFKEVMLPLLSVGQFCQHGMKVTFAKDIVTVCNPQGIIVLT